MSKPKTPNPGSPEAVKQGCTCPVLDNYYGEGSGYLDSKGNPTFWTNADCPLHGRYIDMRTRSKNETTE